MLSADQRHRPLLSLLSLLSLLAVDFKFAPTRHPHRAWGEQRAALRLPPPSRPLHAVYRTLEPSYSESWVCLRPLLA